MLHVFSFYYDLVSKWNIYCLLDISCSILGKFLWFYFNCNTDISLIVRHVLIFNTCITRVKKTHTCAHKSCFPFDSILWIDVQYSYRMALIWQVTGNSDKLPKKIVFFFVLTHLIHSLDKSQTHLELLKMHQSNVNQWKIKDI